MPKSIGTPTERFGYDGEHVWADLDGASTLTARRLFGISIDSPVARVSSGTVAWYLTDYQNSVTQIVNAVGTLGSITYDGFGNIITDTTGGNGDRYKYTGREWDASAQLQYNRARYYDPSIGKWTSTDPIGFEAGDANLYRYVGNGPTNSSDPSGLYDPIAPPGSGPGIMASVKGIIRAIGDWLDEPPPPPTDSNSTGQNNNQGQDGDLPPRPRPSVGFPGVATDGTRFRITEPEPFKMDEFLEPWPKLKPPSREDVLELLKPKPKPKP